MKRLLAPLAALLLAACGGDNADGEPAAQSAAPGGAEAESAAEPGPAERGRVVFNECAICHAVKEDAPKGLGPNLFGVVGREAGTLEGFAYSQAMRNADIVWDEETLDAFIENPQQSVRGNRMAYAGMRNEERRADLIAYLKTLK